ncbi:MULTISPECIES: hypothetical protein [unclassified Pseudoalteromonas]|uniref:hypothetical protein n=1 Tax=unclassified Pseudoalteromonas TaxID=194690 RepID=UPI000CB64976|nr:MULTISPECIES: hypothetical protein [unclassified Pseudoalteromonas]MBH0047370.1 hypothetical protein [Pseudoalteromonas sp. NZS11_1]PLT24189.1 hypothetical protein CXF89_16960 [Pseudoalteromonas sp. MelDa3]
MSIAFDIFIWLIVDTGLSFLFYSTGWLLLKVVTFGQYKSEFKDFASYKASKARRVDLIFLLGFCFYVALIAVMAYLSH